ncbi:MAG: DUF3144 domain-containing protein [Cellvibrionaceae bacterium]|nr:DUF3144 domain-containing protein [Cellvibrionaceae bacterium]
MSDSEQQAIEQGFWDTVEQSLSLANDKGAELDPGVVGEALMYAAARFATFTMAANSESQQDFVTDRSEYFKFLSGRFRDFLDQHFDDYGENYKDYFPNHESESE